MERLKNDARQRILEALRDGRINIEKVGNTITFPSFTMTYGYQEFVFYKEEFLS